jgi:hypothetical protein
MKIETLKPFEMNEDELNSDGTLNPFHQDVSNMGTRLGSNVIIMHSNFDSSPAEYLVVVDTKTGERIKITFDNAKE